MQCSFKEFEPPREDGWRRMRCERCGLTTGFTPHGPEKIYVNVPCGEAAGRIVGQTQVALPNLTGPGTELMNLLTELGLHAKPDCGCYGKSLTMNAWGIEGCIINRALIVAWLKHAYETAGWLETIRAGWRGMFTVNPLDPFNSLLDEAIRRTRL